MNITDFSRGSGRAAFTARADIWGGNAAIDIVLDDDTPRGSHTVDRIYPAVEKTLRMIDLRRGKIETALLDNGWLESAEDWVSSTGKVSKREQGCYIIPGGAGVYLPISEDEFCDSLRIESVCIYFDEELDVNDVTVYIVCDPDYFAGRAVAVLLDNDGGIQIRGLEE